jgi:hypothetical protein
MEVHHHSHTERKKWTHYFWEFLMLFLAVTLGFFVENQREHFIEHKRERQFIVTLVEDLKSDTAQLAAGIEARQEKEFTIDSLVLLLNSGDKSKHGSDLYYWNYMVLRPTRFIPNDRTLQQLKNAGNMRLIRNLEVSDSIMAYDHQLKRLQEIISDEADIRSQFREFAKKLFNGNTLFSILDKKDPAVFHRPPGDPVLMNSDAATINELLVTLQMTQHVMRVGRFSQARLKKSASELIGFLQKEYHLE